jgi:hypothetical protein
MQNASRDGQWLWTLQDQYFMPADAAIKMLFSVGGLEQRPS